MKRKPQDNPSATIGNILTATSVEQRAWIGSVVLAYNEAQTALHELAAAAFNFVTIGNGYSITSRVNGTDGLIQIIKQAVQALQLPEEQSTLFDAALSEQGFAYLKKQRDGVIHAELADSGTELGVAPGARGERQEVLLTSDALKGLYDRLVFVKRELTQLELIIEGQKFLKVVPMLFGQDALDDQRRSLSEQNVQDAIAQCQSHQRQRLSLPPFPKFPEAPDMDDRIAEWLSSPDPNKTLSIRARDPKDGRRT
jgi:hypothetical protein